MILTRPEAHPFEAFTLYFRSRVMLQLRIVGHSLGGGCAALLTLLLKTAYPSVKALAVSPPGGLVSEGACREVRVREHMSARSNGSETAVASCLTTIKILWLCVGTVACFFFYLDVNNCPSFMSSAIQLCFV